MVCGIEMARILFALAALSFLSTVSSQDVMRPPLITQPDRPQKIYFAEKERVLIKCVAEGSPKPSYEWQRNGQVIPSDHEFISFDPRSGMLEIPDFTRREEGEFVCRASNTVGGNVALSFSHPQTILQSRVDKFVRKSDKPVTIPSNEYGYAKLMCTDQGEVVGDPSDITYKWYITQESQQMNTDDGRLFISDDGTLHFTYTLQSDELLGKLTYHCGISSLKARVITLGSPMKLSVQSSAPAAIKPVKTYDNSGKQAKLGTTAKLECVFSGYDTQSEERLPVIKWFNDDGKEIRSGGKFTLTQKNRTLIIADVQEEDDKTFACQGITSAGASDKESVYLNVTSAPIWVEAPKSDTVTAGKDVTIHCHARSLSNEEPPRAPTWYINGREAIDGKFNKSNARLSDDETSFIVTNVTKANDIFCVQCIVKNSLGGTMGDACLNVIDPITITLDCEKCTDTEDEDCSCSDWILSKGDSVQFRLAVATDPGYASKLTSEWTFESETYKLPTLPPQWKHDPVTHVYSFNSSDMSDKDFSKLKGVYFFKTYHSIDSKELSINIDVKGVTPAPLTTEVVELTTESDNSTVAAPVVSSASVEMWIIGLVIGLVFLLIVIILIIFVLVCRKQQEGVYYLGKKETGAGLDPARELKDKAFHDLSRPDYEDYEYPDKKPKGDLEYDDVPIGGDDESLGEYGDEDDIHFNEDGSFIGNYSVKPNNNYRTNESTI